MKKVLSLVSIYKKGFTHASTSYRHGFTLIEIIVVIAISMILAAIVLVSFSDLREGQQLKNAQEEVITFFNEAKSRTIASEDSSAYGVHIESARAVLFKGVTFSEPSTDNKELLLDSTIEITSVSLNGGGSDVIYDRLTGEVDAFGTFILRLISDTSQSKTFTITQTGIMSVE